jgi:hypothetical protein
MLYRFNHVFTSVYRCFVVLQWIKKLEKPHSVSFYDRIPL